MPNDRATEAGIPCAKTIAGERPAWAAIFAKLDLLAGLQVLDFGCGSGVAGFVAEEFDIEPTFVDVKAGVRALLRDLGAERVVAGLNELPKDAYFDLIVLSDVVEHLADPRPLLRELRLLGRRMFLSTPMPDGPVWRELGATNPYWAEIEHYHLFSRQSLARVMRDTGWTIVRRQPGLRYLCGAEFDCVRGIA